MKKNQTKKKKLKAIKPRASFNFKKRVFDVVRKIQKGETMTYGEVARQAGNFRASRAVGAILRTNFDLKIPCHRVIRVDGSLGGYNRGVKNKLKMLRKEKAV